MELKLTRFQFSETETMGRLEIDGAFECWTLEDCVRTGPKVPGKTAIPAGRYAVQVTFSNRFKAYMPLLLDVPNFAGIRIHPGNTAEDTEGCILVGRDRENGRIIQSRTAYGQLFPKILKAWQNQEPIFIEIIEQKETVNA